LSFRVDEVFKALADPSRRKLLDQLYKRDGQTLSQLCEHLPMTRFGTMKHLRVLEEAGLITTRMQGREKLHFLNPVPLRLIHDRWTSKYAALFTRVLGALKQRLEKPMAGENDRPSRVTWLIEKKGETCKVTLTHDDFDGETKTYKSVGPGWNPVLSGLKTLLETGKPLKIASP
jgi:DNA-binding transcriptional ArsR family regulator